MSIEDFINNVTDQNFSKAEPIFHELIQSKLNDALEAERIKVAGQVFNGEEDDEEQLELDLEDEDEDLEDDDDENDDEDE
jgi:hypothetical protein